jgi:hypothetical protein
MSGPTPGNLTQGEKEREYIARLESERDTLRDLLVTCRLRAERAEKALAVAQRKLARYGIPS